MPRVQFQFAASAATSAIMLLMLVAGCSNGGGSAGRESNAAPSVLLNDGDVLGGGQSSIVRIEANDDTGIAQVNATMLRQGNLPECNDRFVDSSIVADQMINACLTDQPACELTFIPQGGVVEVIAPPLYAPIGLEYSLSLVDRDGEATDPVSAVFCFDVGPNQEPFASADTYQVTNPGRVQRNGVRYNNRCEKLDGSQGVLANDEDDEHVTNTCLTAELLTEPQYASNAASFRSSFGSDGRFIYEALNTVPPEDASGRSVDTFTYRVSDGVNPPSDPVTVEIVFTNGNQAPVAADDTFTVDEDAESIRLRVLENDVDPDALPLSVTDISNGPGNGIATIRNGVVIEYRPNADFSGEDRFSYTIVDSGGLSSTANVVVSVVGVNDAPQPVNDAANTNENTSVEIAVLNNDIDRDSSNLTVSAVTTPLHGTAVTTASNAILYTPDLNYFGRDSFEYTVSDGDNTATASVVVNVIFVNVAPVLAADEFSTPEDTAQVFDVLANDSDGDGDVLSVVSVTAPANGTAELLDSGQIRYTPNAGFNGQDNFNYTVSDGEIESTAPVTVVVTSVNDPLVAIDDTASTTEDNAVVIDVLANDTDPDGDSLSVTAVSAARSGQAVVNANGTLTYTPAAGFSGQDSFSYTVTDGTASATANVSVSVGSVNDTPVAVDDAASTSEGAAVRVAVLDNDSDSDGDRLTVAVSSAPANGTAVAQGASILYTPEVGFSGTDQFIYTATDPDGESATATVTINVSSVNQAPIATNDVRITEEGDPVSITVLDNDTDPDGDRLSIDIITQPSNGTARVQGNNRIIYSPASGFSGIDSFVYQVSDGNGATANATVEVTVTGNNGNPTANNDAVSTPEGVAISIDVLANDTDPDADTLTLSLVTAPSNGTAALVSGLISYQPAAGFSGADSLVYGIDDGNGGAATATVNITVSSVNTTPVATADVASTDAATAVTIAVLGNDVDGDGDTLTISSVSTPSGGAAVINGAAIVYTPTAGFSGADTFTYQISDPDGATASATVTVNVAAGNTAPVAVNDTANTNAATPVSIAVLANDTDPDGDALTISSVSAPAGGNAVINGATIDYTPAVAFSGTDTFTYQITDPDGATASASVTVSVAAAANTPPVALDDVATVLAGVQITVPVLGNDSDADGDNMTVSIDTGPTNGFASVDSAGGVVYTSTATFAGIDNIVYSINDGNGGTATAAIEITVTAANQPPVALNDTATTDQDVPVTVDVLANDSDPDDTLITITIEVFPTNGTALIDQATGQVVYTPVAGFSGTDQFTYSVTDPQGESATATVTVNVAAVTVDANGGNQAPVAENDFSTTEENSQVIITVLDNDTDPDGDRLTIDIIVEPSNGTARVRGNTRVVYSPARGFSGVDSFVYQAKDRKGGTATATVEVTVTDNGAGAAGNMVLAESLDL